MGDLESRVMNEVKKLAVVNEVDSLEADLLSLGIDSLVKVELIIALEEEFSIVFDDGSLNVSKLRTIKDICELVEKTLD